MKKETELTKERGWGMLNQKIGVYVQRVLTKTQPVSDRDERTEQDHVEQDHVEQDNQQQSPEQSRGQSLVEMSFILPLLLIILFAIVDISYYIYGYGVIFQSVRRGAETAAYFPPYTSQLEGGRDADGNPVAGAYDMSDKCVSAIVGWAQKGAVLMDLEDISWRRDKFAISYHEWKDLDGDDKKDFNPEPLTGPDARKVGNSVQVVITYTIEPLTPLFQLVPIGDQGRMTVRAVSVRTIQGQGESVSSESGGDLIQCKQ